MKNALSSWKYRRLSLKGKVIAINILAVSPLLYLASVIHVIQEVKKIVVDFIRDSKPPKIAYDVMIQSIENGELKLVDFESKVKSIKLGFIRRLLQNKTGKWRYTAAKFHKTNDSNHYFKWNKSPSNTENKFYEETANYWSELQEIRIPTVEFIHNQTIWEHRYITISNRPRKASSRCMILLKEMVTFSTTARLKKNTISIAISWILFRSGTVFRWNGDSWSEINQSRQKPMSFFSASMAE